MRTKGWVSLGMIALLACVLRADDTAKPDDEGFIRTWLVLAPLPFGDATDGKDALAKQQVPDEVKLQPKEGDKVKVGDQELTWKKYQADTHMVDFNKILDKVTEDSVGYAVCYLVAEEAMKDLTMKTGSDDQAKIYLNGAEVYKNEEARAADKDQDTTPNITLKKGVNVLVFKIVNEKQDWLGCVRFTDKDGNPVKNLKVQLKP